MHRFPKLTGRYLAVFAVAGSMLAGCATQQGTNTAVGTGVGAGTGGAGRGGDRSR